ncbi:MAG TPA: hypothetical protein VN153_08530 [Tahibacter sp.]|nr:hypothetical protein [Tahibacter sp.]
MSSRFKAVLALPVLLTVASGSVCAALPAVEFELLKDTQTAPSASRSSVPTSFTTLGAHVYFSAETPEFGRELYQTDGTAAGLRRLAEVVPGPGSADIRPLDLVGDNVVALVNGGDRTYLWAFATDGSGAVQLSSQFLPSWPGARSAFVGHAGSRVLLALSGPLWSSDGTAAGTAQVATSAGFPNTVRNGCMLGSTAVVAGANAANQLSIGAVGDAGSGELAIPGVNVDFSRYSYAATAGGRCYFLYALAGGGWTFWGSDGTAPGTREITRSVSGVPQGMVGTADDVFLLTSASNANFGSSTVQLQRYTAPMAAPSVVVDLPVQQLAFQRLYAVDGGVAFTGFDASGSNAPLSLLFSDGTAAGTRRVFPSRPEHYLDLNNDLTFFGGAAYTVRWRIELATGNTTTLQANLDTDPVGILGNRMIGAGFGPRGWEVWSSDGTDAGSALLHDIWASTDDGAAADDEWRSAASGGSMYFTHAYELVAPDQRYNLLTRSDGTPQGTTTMPRGDYGHGARQVQQLGDGALVSVHTGLNYGLYRVGSDLGSATLLRSLAYAPRLQATGDGQGLIFGCDIGQGSGELCGLRADGAQALLSPPGTALSAFRPVGQVGGAAVFNAGGGIWRSNGTVPGTFRLLSDRYGRGAPDGPDRPVAAQVLGDSLYFISCGAGSCDLTATDGSVNGTRFVYPVSTSSSVTGIVAVGGRLVFGLRLLGQMQLWQLQLWSSDGTAAGTTLLRAGNVYGDSSLVAAGGYAHAVSTCDGYCGAFYLVTDGTPAGTVSVTAAMPGGAIPVPGVLAPLGGQGVVFTCAAGGFMLCLSDPAGTAMQILPISLLANPGFSLIGTTPTAVYFLADDGHHGREPWVVRLRDAVFADGFSP